MLEGKKRQHGVEGAVPFRLRFVGCPSIGRDELLPKTDVGLADVEKVDLQIGTNLQQLSPGGALGAAVVENLRASWQVYLVEDRRDLMFDAKYVPPVHDAVNGVFVVAVDEDVVLGVVVLLDVGNLNGLSVATTFAKEYLGRPGQELAHRGDRVARAGLVDRRL